MPTNPNRSLVRRVAVVADSDVDSRYFYAVWLRGNGFNVAETTNGSAALNLALHLQPDLVITETRLPQLDGLALCRQLRQHRATSTVPIFVVTADAREVVLDGAVAAGASVALTKPVTFQSLDNALFIMGLLQRQDSGAIAGDTIPELLFGRLACPDCGAALFYEHSYLDCDFEQSDFFTCERCHRRLVRNRATTELRQAG